MRDSVLYLTLKLYLCNAAIWMVLSFCFMLVTKIDLMMGGPPWFAFVPSLLASLPALIAFLIVFHGHKISIVSLEGGFDEGGA